MQPITNYQNFITTTTTNKKTKQQKPISQIAFKGGLATDIVQIASKPKTSFLGEIGNAFLEVIGIKPFATTKKLEKFQKEFKELFLREDISIEETKNIIKNYQKIEKIKDKKEYIQALYKETKKNFGFGEIDLPLSLGTLEHSSTGKTIAGAKSTMQEISVDPSIKREESAGIIYHELRHMKQNFFSACYNIDTYIKGIIKRAFPRIDECIDIVKKAAADAISRIKTKMENRWGTFTKDRIPANKMDYAKKCLDSHIEYVNPHKNLEAYKKNFLEYDAYTSEFQFEKLHKSIKNIRVTD